MGPGLLLGWSLERQERPLALAWLSKVGGALYRGGWKRLAKQRWFPNQVTRQGAASGSHTL